MLKRTLLAAAAAALIAAPTATAYTTWFDFAKTTNANSTLTITWEPMPGKFATASWRSGSGSSTDSCWVGHGWLPNGWYDLWGHWDHYDGSAIKGRVFYLQNKQCWNGTWRGELFVHSEETASNGQYCPTAYDDPFCWEGDSDYYSAGCVKVAHAGAWPTDIALVHNDWHDRSGDGRHGSFSINDWLYVY
jgi:hypothetical protein